MVQFAEIIQPPPPYFMLLYIGRVATLKLLSRNCLRYLQATLIMGVGIGLRVYVRYSWCVFYATRRQVSWCALGYQPSPTPPPYLQKHPRVFRQAPFLKSINWPNLPFRQLTSIYSFFVNLSLKVRFFSYFP